MILLIAITGGIAVHCLHHFWTTANTDYGIAERLKESDDLEDLRSELWFVGELRRTAAMLEVNNQIQMRAVMEGVIGVILGVGAICGSVILVSRWRDGENKEVLAKLARWQIEQWERKERVD